MFNSSAIDVYLEVKNCFIFKYEETTKNFKQEKKPAFKLNSTSNIYLKLKFATMGVCLKIN